MTRVRSLITGIPGRGGAPRPLGEILSRAVLVITALCGLAVVLTAIAVVVLLTAVQPATQRTVDAQQALARVDRGMLDEETGLRGHLLSGQDTFLGPFEAGQAELREGNGALGELAATDASLEGTIAGLQRAEQAWLSGWAQQAAAMPAGAPAAEEFLTQGKRAFDAYRAAESRAAGLLADHLATQRNVQRGILVTVLILDLALIGAIAVVGRSRSRHLHTTVVGPVDELLVSIGRIRDGDLRPPPPPAEPLEMRRLGAGLGEMAVGLAAARGLAERRLDELEARAAELRRAQAAAQDANAAKSAFLSRMSHELRTPLTAILGYSDLLQLAQLSPEHREWAQTIGKAGTHLLELIDDILDISRIEAGRLRLSMEDVDVAEVITGVETLMRPIAAEAGVRVRIEADAGLRVRADHQRLKQILLNLVSNAVKYNRPRGSVELGASRGDDGRARIHVRDTGRGIAPADLDLLFNPFERLDAASSGIVGTGLGLALSRTLAEAMGGSIGVESVLGRGSTFWVELEAVAAGAGTADTVLVGHARTSAAADAAGRATAGAPAADGGAGRRSILYVEDTTANIALVERIAAERPHLQVVPAVQGRLALDLARAHRPALVILDLHLPDIGGDEVLRQLRADPQTAATPIIMLSADTSPGQAERLRAAGADAHLAKPATVPTLLELLDRYVPATEGAST